MTATRHHDTDDDNHNGNGDDNSRMVLRRRRRCSNSVSNDDGDDDAATAMTTAMTMRRQQRQRPCGNCNDCNSGDDEDGKHGDSSDNDEGVGRAAGIAAAMYPEVVARLWPSSRLPKRSEVQSGLDLVHTNSVNGEPRTGPGCQAQNRTPDRTEPRGPAWLKSPGLGSA
ncbi:hypothetical protein EDB85DRAFT_1895294 [Lactarius pseudohatsudake]|nr:hypothetical protein EDB85DRAFT_1895294 [Lactarius pseudohatsudake]